MPQSYHTEFFTATILQWQHLLKDDLCKETIIDSLHWLIDKKRCSVYAFVIMPNHIHLLWKIADGFEREEVQGALLSFTAHAFKKYLKEHNPELLDQHYVQDADRNYQFWERMPMVKECWNEAFMLQKLNYIHANPCQPHWNLAALPEDYKWSSAAFYETDKSADFKWLTHFKN